MTYTCAELEVSAHAYEEIAGKLTAAGYQHAFNPTRASIDMSGIAVSPIPVKAGSMVFQPSYRCGDYDICQWGEGTDWSLYKENLSVLVGKYATPAEAMAAAASDRHRASADQAIYNSIYKAAMGNLYDVSDTNDLTDAEWDAYCAVQDEATRRVDLAYAAVESGEDWEALAAAEGWLPNQDTPSPVSPPEPSATYKAFGPIFRQGYEGYELPEGALNRYERDSAVRTDIEGGSA